MLSFVRILTASLLLIPTMCVAQVPQGGITLRSEGQEVVLSRADLEKIKRRDMTTDAETVSGVSLWDILQLAKVPSPNASGRQRAVMYIKVTGADGQSAVFALVEVDPSFSKRAILVADRRNGKSLDAEEGPWRVFVPDDLRHARWIRGLIAIEVSTIR